MTPSAQASAIQAGLGGLARELAMSVPAPAITLVHNSMEYIPIQLHTWSTAWQADSKCLKMRGCLQAETQSWTSELDKVKEFTV
eukprot:11009013-Karenia_brevis.AAC.1